LSIARVFPRVTKATPRDALAFYDEPGLFVPEVEAVHVSVAFTYDLPQAEYLAKAWERIAPVSIGGPATGERSEEFIPGRYIKPGYVITSRGCPNKCWFCSVWRREGQEVRELPITDGFNVLDDNLLACSDEHIRAVFVMLKRQPESVEFTGGLEAARLTREHVGLISDIRLNQAFFAYDEPADYEPLRAAGLMLTEAGINRTKAGALNHKCRCYVLIGYPKDSIDEAEARLRATAEAGFLPMAMLWKDERGEQPYAWRRFQKFWARPASIHMMLKEEDR
jgi:hypothetical protein